ncbi:MAG: phytoene/squalene synthase family protein [Bacteroidales bacterium]
MSKELYNRNSLVISRITTKHYSTSFSMGISMLYKEFRDPVYAVYGFVRIADEIVDTFHEIDQATTFKEFEAETWKAIAAGFSTNPILHSFQWVVNKYQIPHDLIQSFLYSMSLDLEKKRYSQQGISEYIYGSAEVVGLMCLKIFCKGSQEKYEELVGPARKLGEAFQKVNFLRDLRSDLEERGRVYFACVDFAKFNEKQKKRMVKDVDKDMHEAYQGIKKLDKGARFGVYLAYSYYLRLLYKIRRTPAEKLIQSRVRISNAYKFWLLFVAFLRHKFNLI